MKIHKIEKCIKCGGFLRPLTPDNHAGLDGIINLVENFKAGTEGENLIFITSICAMEYKSKMISFLCPDCCATILSEVIFSLGRRRREILFRKF